MERNFMRPFWSFVFISHIKSRLDNRTGVECSLKRTQTMGLIRHRYAEETKELYTRFVRKERR
jgi:hypothetical protein